MPKYNSFKPVARPQRKWPDKVITSAPVWCSVDLRDGNQSLVNPMSVEAKLEMFDLLLRIGFKHIEIGFPSASQIEFDFARRLIEEDRIPDDVSIQILCQAREHLVEKSLQAVQGAKSVIFHLYNSTSPAHREYTFGMSKDDIIAVAIEGVAMVSSRLSSIDTTALQLQYSPESYSQTEPEFAVMVCSAVLDAWAGRSPVILNLPATVEVSTPNQYADLIEDFIEKMPRRYPYVLSLHTHNDRGTGVAAAEMAILAGADRVEGTLFGNGERTGNLDIVTMALNMYTQGVNPQLDFSFIPSVVESYERLTGMAVPPRQPYAGDLVFTAFSGSHQDAIKKGIEKRNAKIMQARKTLENAGCTDSTTLEATAFDISWDIPYLPLDPHDIGRSYEAIIRINSQSGKGGVAWILKDRYKIDLPKSMHPEIGLIVNEYADKMGKELEPEIVYQVFQKTYLDLKGPIKLSGFHGETYDEASNTTAINAELEINGALHAVHHVGNGPLDALMHELTARGFGGFELADFHEAAIGEGADSRAAAFVRIVLPIPGSSRKKEFWGCGIHPSITTAGLLALISAVNRVHTKQSDI